MNTTISRMEKMLLLSIGFTGLLLLTRILYTGERAYGFYCWNTFLAMIPMLFSRLLYAEPAIRRRSVFLIGGWLIFFPNAPYIITDLFHFSVRSGALGWFDILLVISASWNGLALGMLSLLQVEQFLLNHLPKKWVAFSSAIFILLCGYGVYLGRYMRFNSWDILRHPHKLVASMVHSVIHPVDNSSLWVFTGLFSGLFGIIFFTLKSAKEFSRDEVTDAARRNESF